MTMTDPIADMLTRVRNALMARHDDVLVPASRIKEDIARILRDEGYILGYDLFQDGSRRMMRIRLKYSEGYESVISGLRRVSKPGQRIYTSREEIPRVKGGLGVAILSTSKGVITGADAWNAGVGGEVLCLVW